MFVQVYQTNFEDVYVGISVAQVDQFSNEVMMPERCYLDAPPVAPEGKVVVRVEGAWQIVDDPRGKIYYVDGVEHKVDVVKFVMPTGGVWKSDYLRGLSVLELYTDDVRNRLDSFARSKGYDSITSAASYQLSTDQVWAYEGARAAKLRDETWRAFYQYEKDVESGAKEKPEAFSQIVPSLPELSW